MPVATIAECPTRRRSPPEILVPPDRMAGVWANWTDVRWSQHEFMLDFAQMDSTVPPSPGRGILVARVAASSGLVVQLMQILEQAWQSYAESALPPDIHGEESQEEL